MSEKTLATKVLRALRKHDYETVAERYDISIGHIYCLELQYGAR